VRFESERYEKAKHFRKRKEVFLGNTAAYDMEGWAFVAITIPGIEKNSKKGGEELTLTFLIA